MGSDATRRVGQAAELSAAAAIALAARLAYPNPWTHTDEHFHLLAARSLLHEGTLRITPEAPLLYDRAWAFTYAVAGSQRLFGETVWAARLPSVICGVLLVAAVFAFVRRHVDRASAWCASLLLGFSLPALQMSALGRFYMPHALMVFLAAWAAYELVACRRWRHAGWWAVLLSCMLVGFHLQEITVIAGGAIGVWCAGWCLVAIARGQLPRPSPSVWLAIAAAIGACIVIVFISGFAEHLWARYSAPRVWAEDTAGDTRFYHRIMLDRRPLFYAALPIATLVAMRLRPTVTLWALTLFAVPFVTHSLISPKAERYVFYVLPFFFVAWGIAGAAGLRALYAAAVAVIPTSAPRRLASVATVAVLIFPAVYLLGHEYRTAAQLFAGKVHYTPYREPDWAVAAARVAPAIAEAEFIIGSSGPDELYHLGRCDAFLNVSAVAKNGEFALTDRLGRPAISTPESLARLVHEHPSGLVFVARSDWRDPTHVTDAAADYLETNLERVPDPARDVMMFRWPKPTVENRR